MENPVIDVFLIAIAAGFIAALSLAAILVALVCWWIGASARGAWRRARTVIEETRARPGDEPELSDEAVRKLTTIVFCPPCTDGHGRCTCVAYCGHQQCTYGHTMQLSATESAWLRQLGIKEGTDR